MLSLHLGCAGSVQQLHRGTTVEEPQNVELQFR
jgi:hypothetical protein